MAISRPGLLGGNWPLPSKPNVTVAVGVDFVSLRAFAKQAGIATRRLAEHKEGQRHTSGIRDIDDRMDL